MVILRHRWTPSRSVNCRHGAARVAPRFAAQPHRILLSEDQPRLQQTALANTLPCHFHHPRRAFRQLLCTERDRRHLCAADPFAGSRARETRSSQKSGEKNKKEEAKKEKKKKGKKKLAGSSQTSFSPALFDPNRPVTQAGNLEALVTNTAKVGRLCGGLGGGGGGLGLVFLCGLSRAPGLADDPSAFRWLLTGHQRVVEIK